MNFLFGNQKPPQELLARNKRALNRAIRELDRERQKLEVNEKKVITDIKIMSKRGETEAVRILAQEVVRTRRFIKKFIRMKANIQALSLQIQTMKTNNDMGLALKGVSRALSAINKQMNLPAIQKIMHNFQKECTMMDMKQEMMEEAIDDITAEGEEDEETELLTNKILDELGIVAVNEIDNLPATAVKNQAGNEQDIDDLEERLEKLRKE